jgi:hypothetical protein
MSTNFLTFANTDYMSTDRIASQASEFNIFSSITCWTEDDIPEFIDKHRHHFNLYSDKFGLWLWKPYIIQKRLNELNEGDYLLYLDAGSHLNKKGLSRFNEYISFLKNENISIVAFQANDCYKAKFYVKADCVNSYFPKFYELNNNAYYAGVLLMKNTDFTRRLISEWLSLCENTHFLVPSPSVKFKDPRFFKGQDGDNGILNLVIEKFRYKYQNLEQIISIYPDEVNVYHSNGMQLTHALNYKNYSNTSNWARLDKFPIQYRRDRPLSVSNNNSKMNFKLRYIYNPLRLYFISIRNFLGI